MAFNAIGYVIKQSLLSLKRNFWLSAASILTVMISLTILGYSIFFLVNTENIADTFESQVEIAVFLNDDLTDSQITDLKSQIQSIDGVATATLTTKEQAIVDFQETMDSDSLLEDLGGVNPFPNKITITTTDASLVEGVAAQVGGLTGIDRVRYGQGFVEKLVVFTTWLRWVGIGVVVAFACASFLLIVLNIKTNVNSREKEIQIMRLVGASKSFVRWPFLIEGVFIGMIGGVMAVALVGSTYTWLLNYVISSLTFLPVVSSQQFILSVLLIMFLGGIVMGFLASAFSVRKFLNI